MPMPYRVMFCAMPCYCLLGTVGLFMPLFAGGDSVESGERGECGEIKRRHIYRLPIRPNVTKKLEMSKCLGRSMAIGCGRT